MWDELPSRPPARERWRFWPKSISEAGAAFGTFLLSLAVFSVAGLNAVRGSRVVVLPPETVLFYRDGEGTKAVMLLAVPARMINAASQDYGDVVVTAAAHIGPPERREPARFEFDSLVEPIFTQDAREQAGACGPGVRCVATAKLLVAERPRKLLDLPGGSSRSEYLSFRLNQTQCSGSRTCQAYGDFSSVLALIGRERPLDITVDLQFHSDGEHTITCPVDDHQPGRRQAWTNYLEEEGWATLTCKRA